MKLKEHLRAIREAADCESLESAMQAGCDAFPNWAFPRSRTGAQLRRAVIEGGTRLCLQHPAGTLVPLLGKRHRLMLCGETFLVAYGHNSTGVRYAWAEARNWALLVLKEHGVPAHEADLIWQWSGSYPHRALQIAIELRLAPPIT